MAIIDATFRFPFVCRFVGGACLGAAGGLLAVSADRGITWLAIVLLTAGLLLLGTSAGAGHCAARRAGAPGAQRSAS